MNTTDYLNAPAKGCATCVFLQPGTLGAVFWRCGRTGRYCGHETLDSGPCGPTMQHWKPKPPRRSLRRWLYETFWE